MKALQTLWLNEINTLRAFTSQSMVAMLWEASGGITLWDLVHQLVEWRRRLMVRAWLKRRWTHESRLALDCPCWWFFVYAHRPGWLERRGKRLSAAG